MLPHALFDVLCINEASHADKVLVDVEYLFTGKNLSGDAIYCFIGMIFRKFRSPPSQELHQLAPQCFVFLTGRVAIWIEARKQQVECLSRYLPILFTRWFAFHK